VQPAPEVIGASSTTLDPGFTLYKASRPVAGWPTAAGSVAGRTGDGYLAPIEKGEELVLLHIGTESTDEEGWAYMRRAEMPYEEGWVCMDVLTGEPENSNVQDAEERLVHCQRPNPCRSHHLVTWSIIFGLGERPAVCVKPPMGTLRRVIRS